MGWDDVATLWDDQDDKNKVSSTSKERVENTGNNVDVENGHTYGHAYNTYDGHTDGHVDARTWSDVVSRGAIKGRNKQK